MVADIAIRCSRPFPTHSVSSSPPPPLSPRARHLLFSEPCDLAVTRGSSWYAPSSVTFSTSQSTRPPFRVVHATAQVIAGPIQGSFTTFEVTSNKALNFSLVSTRQSTVEPLPSQSCTASPNFSRSTLRACFASSPSKMKVDPGAVGRGGGQ